LDVSNSAYTVPAARSINALIAAQGRALHYNLVGDPAASFVNAIFIFFSGVTNR
jgi:hypothetical protein